MWMRDLENVRRYDRAEVDLVVHISLPHGAQVTKNQAVIRVLGGGGVFLEIDETCPVGMLVLLRFTLPGDDDAVVCHGVVCHAVEGEGLGLEFLDIRSTDRERLVAFVDRRRADS
jgi:PilZ domain